MRLRDTIAITLGTALGTISGAVCWKLLNVLAPGYVEARAAQRGLDALARYGEPFVRDPFREWPDEPLQPRALWDTLQTNADAKRVKK